MSIARAGSSPAFGTILLTTGIAGRNTEFYNSCRLGIVQKPLYRGFLLATEWYWLGVMPFFCFRLGVKPR